METFKTIIEFSDRGDMNCFVEWFQNKGFEMFMRENEHETKHTIKEISETTYFSEYNEDTGETDKISYIELN